MKKGQKKKNAWVNSSQADAAADYYVNGHTVSETAEYFGITKCQVNNLAKTRKLTNGRNYTDGHKEANRMRSNEAERKLAESLNVQGFLYLGGYAGKYSSVRIKCLKCESEFNRTVGPIKAGTIRCLECQKRETRERCEAEKKKRADQAEVKRLEKEWYKLFHPAKDAYADIHESFLNRTGVCEICGAIYTVRDYVESCGFKKAQDNGVCSEKCRRIKKNRSARDSRKRRGVKDNHRHRARKYGCEYDSSVTIQNLIKRNGLRCAICGGMCDWNDHSWSEYSGPLYPSIDHIIPMSKGGGHTWDNVQIVHMICNSEKGDKVVSE